MGCGCLCYRRSIAQSGSIILWSTWLLNVICLPFSPGTDMRRNNHRPSSLGSKPAAPQRPLRSWTRPHTPWRPWRGCPSCTARHSASIGCYLQKKANNVGFSVGRKQLNFFWIQAHYAMQYYTRRGVGSRNYAKVCRWFGSNFPRERPTHID